MRRTPTSPGRWILDRRITALTAGVLAGTLAGALGCSPTIDNDGCSQDVDCTGRGQVCDILDNACIPAVVDTTATESPAPMTFSTAIVPFHRGQVCLPQDVKSGSNIPVTLIPCFHPCLDQGMFKHKHYYECVGARCDAWAVMYIEASSIPEGCPADAFGAFDRSLCSNAPVVNLAVGTTIDSGPVNGTMAFEIPFLTNADAAAIAANFDDDALIQDRIDQYPADDKRVPGGREISLSPNHPEPPASCETGCTCFDVGF